MVRCKRSFRAVRNCAAGTFTPTTSRGWGSTWTRRKRRSTHLCSSCRRGRWPAGPTGPPCGRRALSRVLELLSRMPQDMDHCAWTMAPVAGKATMRRWAARRRDKEVSSMAKEAVARKALANAGSQIPRSEHPRPQMMRRDWLNLNGIWTFSFGWGRSGMERGLQRAKGFEREILVPFAPESELSGVGYKDFIETMWYHRRIEIPAAWADRKVLLHFGGVDYHCEAFIDGASVGRHWGGSVSFTFDITRKVKPGTVHDLVLYVEDDTRSGIQPVGKQSQRYHSYACHYTRTTGIWQTVWLEAVSPYGLESFQDRKSSRLN